ncbi:MAG: hypothetical protein AAF697_01405 [Pseudomonadota bacterium]
MTFRFGMAVAATLALTACAEGTEPAPAGDVADEIASQEPGGMQPGLYAVGDGTQVYSRTRVSDDGTYVDLNDAMEPVANGTWEVRDETVCFDPEGDGEDQQEACWTNGPADADGSFMSTSVDGEQSYRVTPLEE